MKPHTFEPSQHLILIVDDSKTNLDMLRDYLGNQQGFEIMVARNGSLGLKRAQLAKPDLILLDVMMPGINGFELCQQLQADPITAEIPIIFMTAMISPDDKVKGFASGAVDYVTKPLHHPEILARITTHLKLRSLTKQLQTQAADLAKQAAQLETSSQVTKRVTAILEPDELLVKVVHLLQSRFAYYHIQIYLLDERGDALVLVEGTGEVCLQLKREGYQIPLTTKTNVIVQAAQSNKMVTANKTEHANQWSPHPLLPETEMEIAVPIVVGPKLIGVLDVQQTNITNLTQADEALLTSLAGQIGIALQNARLYKELTILNANKDKLFSIVAHDLRNPFTPLLNNLQKLSKTLPTLTTPQIKSRLNQTHLEVKNVYNLLESLLHWASLQMERVNYAPEPIPLKRTVQETIQLLLENAQLKQITLQNNLPEGVWVYADQNVLKTVLRNLTSNALKFTSVGGSITLSAQVHTSEAKVVVSVTDTGVGIDKTRLKRLFRIETQHSTLGTHQEKGTGLGLIICREMVERIGGQIWVESEVGQGTTFRFSAPLDRITAITMPDKNITAPQPTTNTSAHSQPETSLIPPPQVELQNLFDVALQGSMTEIKQHAIHIKNMGKAYHPFADKIEMLAEKFEDEAILNLLKQYMI